MADRRWSCMGVPTAPGVGGRIALSPLGPGRAATQHWRLTYALWRVARRRVWLPLLVGVCLSVCGCRSSLGPGEQRLESVRTVEFPIEGLSWSPDGRWLALVARRQNPQDPRRHRSVLHLFHPDSGTLLRSMSWDVTSEVAWRPDSRTCALVAMPIGIYERHASLLAADPQRRILRTRAAPEDLVIGSHLRFTPDGRLLVIPALLRGSGREQWWARNCVWVGDAQGAEVGLVELPSGPAGHSLFISAEGQPETLVGLADISDSKAAGVASSGLYVWASKAAVETGRISYRPVRGPNLHLREALAHVKAAAGGGFLLQADPRGKTGLWVVDTGAATSSVFRGTFNTHRAEWVPAPDAHSIVLLFPEAGTVRQWFFADAKRPVTSWSVPTGASLPAQPFGPRAEELTYLVPEENAVYVVSLTTGKSRLVLRGEPPSSTN